jgi:hypothetical protein
MRRAPADGAGNTRQEFEAGHAGIARAQCDIEVEGRGAGAHRRAVDGDLGEAASQADDHAGHAAVAHQQIGADADAGDRNVRRLAGQERDEISAVGRAEHHFGRTADAEPGDTRERCILGQTAAHRREPLRSDAESHRRRHHCDFLSA